MNGVVNRFRRKIHSHGGGCRTSKIGCPVTRTASQVEDATPLCKPHGQRVSRHMFRPQIIIHLTGNDAFAREFGHGVVTLPATPPPSLVFTLTRQSR